MRNSQKILVRFSPEASGEISREGPETSGEILTAVSREYLTILLIYTWIRIAKCALHTLKMQLDKHTAATNTAQNTTRQAQNTTRQAQTQLDKHNVGGEHDVDAGAGDAGEVGLE